jgi:hypothetical protein
MAYDSDTNIRAPRSQRWQDWINLILAVWLFLSPWIINFGGSAYAGITETGAGGYGAATNVAAAAWNAWIFGVIVFLIALSAIGRMQFWQEWINLLIGIWLFIAPWVLGFVALPGASWDHWIVGVLVFIFAAWNLGAVRRIPAAPNADVPPLQP